MHLCRLGGGGEEQGRGAVAAAGGECRGGLEKKLQVRIQSAAAPTTPIGVVGPYGRRRTDLDSDKNLRLLSETCKM